MTARTYTIYYRDGERRGERYATSGVWQYAYRTARDLSARWGVETWVFRTIERRGRVRDALMAEYRDGKRVRRQAQAQAS